MRQLVDPDTGELVEVIPEAAIGSEPYDFAQAKGVSMQAHRTRRDAEEELKRAIREAAEAESAYRKTLATAIVEEKAAHGSVVGVETAKGRDDVCQAREARDVASGMVDAAKERLRLCSEDRASAHRLIEWSMNRERWGHE